MKARCKQILKLVLCLWLGIFAKRKQKLGVEHVLFFIPACTGQPVKNEVAINMFDCDSTADSSHCDPLSVDLHAARQHFQTYQQPSSLFQYNLILFSLLMEFKAAPGKSLTRS